MGRDRSLITGSDLLIAGGVLAVIAAGRLQVQIAGPDEHQEGRCARLRRPVPAPFRVREALTGDHLRVATAYRPGVDESAEAIEAIAPTDLPWGQSATVGLAVQDHWDTVVTVPVTRDHTSTTTMVTTLPSLTLAHPDLAESVNAHWHVDVQWRDGHTVRHRGLDSRELFADRSPFDADLGTAEPSWHDLSSPTL